MANKVTLIHKTPNTVIINTSGVSNGGDATWGSITGIISNQTDLVNYVDTAIAAIPPPVIPTPPTPTLQSVTDEGNTTTNNIGIGTTSPSALLEISGGGTTTDFLKLTTTAGGATPVKLIFEKSAAEQGIIEFNRNGDLEIYNTDNDGGVLISGSGSATADMYINHSGNVGIGTTAPDEKLRVQGNIKSAGDFIGSAVKLGFAGTANITTYDTNEDLLINPNGSGDILMQTASTGNVGIGTTAPAAKLDVNGTTYLRSVALNTVFGYSGNNIQFINTGNTTFAGNVGIGTTAPSHKLEVNGDIGVPLGDNLRWGSQLGIRKDNNGELNFFAGTNSTNGGFNFRGWNGSAYESGTLVIRNNGNVGIGTTAPTEKLDVAGNIRAYASTGTVTIGTEKDGNYARLNSDGTSGYISYGNVNGASRVLRFVGNSSEVARFDSSGNLGVGTTAPAAKLEVHQSADSQGLKIVGFDNEDNSNLHLFVDNFGNGKINSTEFLQINAGGSSRYRTVGYLRLEVGGTGNQLQIDYNYIKFTSGGTETMRITPGNVGIGTTAPTEKLEVVGKAIIRKSGTATPHGDTDFLVTDSTAALSTAQMQILGGNNASSILYFSDTDAYNVGGIKYEHSDNSMRLQVNSSEQVIITDTGNVGIGTTAPSAKLDVNGSIYPTTHNGGTLGLLQYKEWSYVATRRITGDNNRMELVLSNETVILKDHNTIGDGIQIKSRNNVLAQFGDANGSGNVGIGTTAPDDRLTIAGGNVSTKHIGYATDALKITHNSNDVLLSLYKRSSQSSPDVQIRTNGNSYINGGNVGIGTTAPTEKLEVAGNVLIDSTGVLRYTIQDTVSGRFGEMRITGDSSRYFEIRGYQNATILRQGGFGNVFLEGGNTIGFVTGASERIRINSSGNVGIGTTAPTSLLHVKDNVNGRVHIEAGTSGGTSNSTARLIIEDNTSNAIQFLTPAGSFNSAIYFGDADNSSRGVINYNHSADQLNLESSNGILLRSGGQNILQVDSSYRVGIGTTSPVNKLHVNAGGVNQVATFESTDATAHITLKDNAGALYLNRGTGQSSIGSVIGDSTSNITIKDTGEVGIGTTAPSSTLHVAGTARIHSAANGAFGTLTLGSINHIVGDVTYINFKNNNNSWMMILNGNVGIGTTAPAAKLDVVGTIKLDDGGGSVYVGNAAGYNDDKTFNYNVGIGDNALAANTSGNNNIAVGSYALYNPTNTSGNIAIGGSALGDTTTGYRNTAVGHLAHSLNTSGYENVAIGHNALGSATSPYQSVAVGSYALGNANGVASDNTGIGYYAMSLLTTGRYNTSLGTYALSDTVLGSNNTAVGYYAGGGDYQGTNSVYLGMNTAPNSDNETNQVVIGYGATGNGSNSVTLGNASIAKTVLRGKVGAGTTSPSSQLQVNAAAMEQFRLETLGGPANNADAKGNVGDIAYDDDFMYIKTNNGWGRIPLDFGF